MDELMTCPFCRGNDLSPRATDQDFWVECKKCGCEGPVASNYIGSIKAWNTRHKKPITIGKQYKCFVCGELTEPLAANPGMWGFYFPHIDGSGKHRYYHIKCLYPILKSKKPIVWPEKMKEEWAYDQGYNAAIDACRRAVEGEQ